MRFLKYLKGVINIIGKGTWKKNSTTHVLNPGKTNSLPPPLPVMKELVKEKEGLHAFGLILYLISLSATAHCCSDTWHLKPPTECFLPDLNR